MPRPYIPKKIVPNKSAQLVAEDRDKFATFQNVDFQRSRFWCLTANISYNTPRRLGGDASPVELTADKRIGRRICSAYGTLWRLYHQEMQVPPPPVWSDNNILTRDPIMVRVGTTVLWPTQINYLIGVVNRRMTLLTDFMHLAKVDNMTRWYHKHGELLNWELEALHRVNKYVAETKSPDYKVSYFFAGR